MLSGIKVDSETTWRFFFLPLDCKWIWGRLSLLQCITRPQRLIQPLRRPGGGRMFPWLRLMKWALLLLLGTQTWESELLANEPYNEALEMSSFHSIAFSAYRLTDCDCQSAAWQNRVCRLGWNVVVRPVGCGTLTLQKSQKMLSSLGQRGLLSISDGDSSLPGFPCLSYVLYRVSLYKQSGESCPESPRHEISRQDGKKKKVIIYLCQTHLSSQLLQKGDSHFFFFFSRNQSVAWFLSSQV